RDPAGPFGPCHSRLGPGDFFNNCVHDVCVAQGDQRVLCRSLQAYATACQAAGARIQPWRTNEFCRTSSLTLVWPTRRSYL
ncbi:FCGBP protein, partial [Ceuthmochares aereus]|nr:FCGBP protein [Ceuthmochares aereus]